MIQRKSEPRYYVGEQEFKTLRDAQVKQLSDLFSAASVTQDIDAALAVLNNSEIVMDVLTTTERSLATARKINGGRKPRKQRKPDTAQITLPGVTTTPEAA